MVIGASHSVNLSGRPLSVCPNGNASFSAAVNPWSQRLRPAAGRLKKGHSAARIPFNWGKETAQKLFAKAGSHSASKFELLCLHRKTHKQRTKMLPSPFGFGISADDEFLLQVELDFDPCSGALLRPSYREPLRLAIRPSSPILGPATTGLLRRASGLPNRHKQ